MKKEPRSSPVTAGLPMYSKFMLLVMLFLTVSGLTLWQLGWVGITELARDKQTLYAASFMLVAFLIGGWSTHGVVRRLLRDQRALDELDVYLGMHQVKSPRDFRQVILNICHEPERLLGGRSRVAHAMRLLGVRHDISKAHQVKTPINRSAFHADFESGVAHDMDRIDFYVVLYAFLGLVGFTGIIYLTWKGLPVPKTIEQVADYNRYLLTGLGLTYLLTFLGIGSATLTFVAKHFVLHDHYGEVSGRFRDANFAVIFPVLHGSIAAHDAKEEVADEKA